VRESDVAGIGKSIKAEELPGKRGGGISALPRHPFELRLCISTVLEGSSVLLSWHQGGANCQAGYPDSLAAYLFSAESMRKSLSNVWQKLSEFADVRSHSPIAENGNPPVQRANFSSAVFRLAVGARAETNAEGSWW
jgi:hypothetical protein